MKAILWILLITLCSSSGALADAFDPGKVGFTVRVNDNPVPYHRFMATALPDHTVTLRVEPPLMASDLRPSADTGRLVAVGNRGWDWQAPDVPGQYDIRLEHLDTGATMNLTVFVLVPLSEVRDGRLNGYRIGQYPATPFRGLSAYRAPAGLIEVTPDNEHHPVSPHFTLGQFVSKQPAGYPRYLVLRPRLLSKLELLLEDVNNAGIRTDGFVVMSGYRTPFYNRAIGSSTNSRHMYGGAADVFIDTRPPRGMMDDLNNDGVIDRRDAAILYDLAHTLPRRHDRPDLIGGVGEYDTRPPIRGPFVHVDVRGFRARWGRPTE